MCLLILLTVGVLLQACGVCGPMADLYEWACLHVGWGSVTMCVVLYVPTACPVNYILYDNKGCCCVLKGRMYCWSKCSMSCCPGKVDLALCHPVSISDSDSRGDFCLLLTRFSFKVKKCQLARGLESNWLIENSSYSSTCKLWAAELSI